MAVDDHTFLVFEQPTDRERGRREREGGGGGGVGCCSLRLLLLCQINIVDVICFVLHTTSRKCHIPRIYEQNVMVLYSFGRRVT